MHALGFDLLRDVEPGEAIFVDLTGTLHARQCAQAPRLVPCIFEYVYLARPDSVIDGTSVRQKLNPIASEFDGKVVLLVDDSIVRGTTSREIVQMAREAGARKVYFASAAPPVRFPSVYGIDMPTPRELVATGRSEAEVAVEIGADLLIYQDLEALKQAVRDANPRTAGYLSQLADDRDEARGDDDSDLVEMTRVRAVC